MTDAASHSSAPAINVWLVIPVHNRREVTARCLRHLKELGIPFWMRVLVVDDGSTDGTADLVAAEFPWVAILAGNGEWWWAGAIRQGMETAMREGAECICWLNDDSLPDVGSLELLVRHACEHGALCGGICPTGGPGGFAYGGGMMSRGWPKNCQPMPQPGALARQVEWLHGNMEAVPAAVWQRIGLPQCRWAKHHFADVEYTHRAARAGIPVLLLPDATGRADWNDGGSYVSWLDRRLTIQALVCGFWNPKMWWYAPGVAFFQIRTFGLPGFFRFILLFPKAFAVVLFKLLPRWGGTLDKTGQP